MSQTESRIHLCPALSHILVLDANEVTNQVDVSLSSYDEETISAIQDLVEGRFEHTSHLNFIDLSGCTPVWTAAAERPNENNARANKKFPVCVADGEFHCCE